MTEFLLLSVIFLAAGVLSVPIASKLGLGSVLGYLLAGIAIAPLLSLLHVDVVSIQHFAEFGVVMMLFIVGLELEPEKLWEMRHRLLGLGGIQVLGTAMAVFAIALYFLPWSIALAIGFVLALSSTAIVLQTLNEKGLMKSDGGQSSFSVLLFQDIAVIPILAFLPLLANTDLMAQLAPVVDAAHGADDHGGGDHGSSLSLVEGLGPFARTGVTLAAIAFVFLAGHYLTRPMFRFIAKAGLRELFTAAALLLVMGIALLMTLVGVSAALGTFMAGVILASSEYRHELESDIDPFKGLLLGLFFITVGAGINFTLLADNIGMIAAMVVGLIALKATILYILARVFKIGGADRWLFTLGLAQAGEFGFVLLSFTVAENVIPKVIADQLLLVVALSMLLTPLLFIFYERVIVGHLLKGQEREMDEIDEPGDIIIAGHGRVGGIVNRLLSSFGFRTTVLDYSSEQLDMLRMFGLKVFYGDATRPDLLHAAGIEKARMLVIALDDKEQITKLTDYAVKTYPHLHVLARAVDRPHVYELWAVGCRDVIRETYDSSLRMGRSALEALGYSRTRAQSLTDKFEEADRSSIREMADLYKIGVPLQENQPFVERARALRDELEAELKRHRLAMDEEEE